MATYKRYLTYNFLMEQYVNQRRSCLDIGREVGCSGVTVHNFLKKFNIARRSRLEAISKKREEKKKLTEEQKKERMLEMIKKADELMREGRALLKESRLSPTEKERLRLRDHAKQKRLALEKLQRELEFDNQRESGAWHTGDWRDQLLDIMEHTRDKS